jgi:hypothetical protein
MNHPKNIVAILDWFQRNRKDIPINVIEDSLERDVFILIATAAFEAGREFQKANPTMELGPSVYLD